MTSYSWAGSASKSLHRLVNLRREIAKRRSHSNASPQHAAELAARQAELAELTASLGARPGREIIDALDSLGFLP